VASLSVLTALAVTGAVSGNGPFVAQTPVANLIQLQYFLIALCVPLLLLASVVRQHARATQALREEEQRYREVVECQTDLVCRYLPDTTLTFVNEAYCRYFARRREELLGTRFLGLIPESARAGSLRHIGSLMEHPRAEVIEHEVVLPDGGAGWQRWTNHAICDASGKVVEFQAIGHDITQRRRAEEALRASLQKVQELAGRLIAAQESERSRIAGELHDDFGQRLAAISLGLSLLRRKSDSEARLQIESLQRGLAELADEIRDLSHELHPGVLRHGGLGPALSARAAEFSRHHGIEVAVDAQDDGPMPADLALCLYRVAQEALQNVARHAHATRAEVVLRRERAGVWMTVTDDGRGFDPRAASSGLGLISLEERVRQAGGSLIIESKPLRGTRMRIDVPIGETAHAHATGAPGR